MASKHFGPAKAESGGRPGATVSRAFEESLETALLSALRRRNLLSQPQLERCLTLAGREKHIKTQAGRPEGQPPAPSA